MTAIVGAWRLDGSPDTKELCGRMLRSQAVYGPHDRRAWADADLAMGRNLFRQLKEDAYDRQPIVGESGQVLVADVRLDNRADLIAELAIQSGCAELASDAQILLWAWECWGRRCFTRLVGDYAFAVWDPRERVLVLARDPLGQRPLHYHEAPGLFAFSSMPKGLHALPSLPIAPDEAAILEFVALLPPSPSRSFFQGIRRVDPGCMVIIKGGRVDVQRHWAPARRLIRLGSSQAYAEALRTHLDEAVRCRLRRASGQVASHLSSGWDSAAVTATAARELSKTGETLFAFTAVPREGYDGPAPFNRINDEGHLARATASLYPNIEHTLVHRRGASPLADFDRHHFLFEQPITNPCNAVWDRAINDVASKGGATVMLNGTRGNASLTYNGLDWLPELIQNGRWLKWAAVARRARRNSGMRWRGIFALSFAHLLPGAVWQFIHEKYYNISRGLTEFSMARPELLSGEPLRRAAAQRGLDLHGRSIGDTFVERLSDLQSFDGGNYNKGALAAWGIDHRDPTADRRLVEFCLSVPNDEVFVDGRPRSLARRALADRLPASVLNETRRGYQGADWHEGATAHRGAILEEINRISSNAVSDQMFDTDRMRRLLAAWPSGGWEDTNTRVAYRHALLRGLAVGHFLRTASGRNE